LDVVWLCNEEEVRYQNVGKTEDKLVGEEKLPFERYHKFFLPDVLPHFGDGFLTSIYFPVKEWK